MPPPTWELDAVPHEEDWEVVTNLQTASHPQQQLHLTPATGQHHMPHSPHRCRLELSLRDRAACPYTAVGAK